MNSTVYTRYFARSAYPGHRVVRIVRDRGHKYIVQCVAYDPEETIERESYQGSAFLAACKLADSWCFAILGIPQWYEMFAPAERGADHAS